MKKIYTTVLSAIIAGTVFGQITINSTNVVDVGDAMHAANTNSIIDAGQPGANQTWDLTGMVSQSIDTVLFQDPSGFPLFNTNFSTANLGVADDSSWNFFRKSSSEFTFLGFLDISGVENDTIIVNWSWINFPANFGDQYTSVISEFSFGDSLGMFGVDSFRVNSISRIKSEIDGWGVVKTPAGNWDALRQINNFQFLQYVDAKIGGNWAPMSQSLLNVFGQDTGVVDESTFYRWWGNDANAKVMVATLDTAEIFDGSWYLNIAPSGPPLGLPISLIRNDVNIYPNPTTNYLNIDINSERGRVIIRNIFGQKIAEKIISQGNNLVDFGNEVNGNYIIEVENERGERIKSESIQVIK